MEDFFNYATKNGLNITTEVQNCQNLCLLTYGVGNPDLSGIGLIDRHFLSLQMMYAYSVQTGLTILIGPVYRLLYYALSPASSLIRELKAIQTNFFSSNGFFIASSALASLAHLSQNPSTFEVAEMQAMAFLQINSILVTFFCLVVVQPMSRWAARVLLYLVVFALVLVVLGKSHLNSSSKANWRLASDGCAHTSTDYSVINPVPYPSWTVAIFAVAGTIAFWLQSLKQKFQRDKLHKTLFRVLMLFWVLLIGLLTAGMIVGLTMMWRQRRHLRTLARDKFEDDAWGFGQVAALTIWAPIPVELLYILNDLAQKKFPRCNQWNQAISVFFSPKAVKQDQTTPRGNSQPEGKDQGDNATVVEVANS
ncbi:hypothetical protein CNMCM5793_006731 [Aspergillus hiratsukae]|uniref:Uncharacterized protein n=1 Tax=Aspergillus hiratsukae TaxID=1194566 RepID=A0A8H6QI52_9EURO|nr:hypothetical protein CNMCM5793_006731 [Aspergillus hiratsukae]KAF7173546.1 hypothetical protein CNMCM6106_007619 [Aspergillus hiratsukae]